MHISSNLLYPKLIEYKTSLEELRQVPLKRESDFIGWAKKRGIELSGIVSNTDVADFWQRGWLRIDRIMVRDLAKRVIVKGAYVERQDNVAIGVSAEPPADGTHLDLYIHPFRLYSTYSLLMPRMGINRSALLFHQGGIGTAEWLRQQATEWSESEEFLPFLDWINGVCDLSILLEPLYWPTMTRIVRGAQARGKSDNLLQFREDVLQIVTEIPKDEIAKAHEHLRIYASILDENEELYLLMRCANWERRERLEGAIGGALWFRHLAEVIRRAYEEIHEDRLPHEDEAFGYWYEGARKELYGSDHPTDDIDTLLKRLLTRWGIQNSVVVRFYVEGPTEKGALELALGSVLGLGVEVVSVRGSDWGTWFEQELRNDVQAKRFSMLMLDSDVPDAVRSVKSHAQNGLIVGMVLLNDPDIETGCFTIEQLCRAAEEMERESGYHDLPSLDRASFAGVSSGKEFEKLYRAARNSPGLKGPKWGEALVRIAYKDRINNSDEANRLVHAVACALRFIETDYDGFAKDYPLDPDTLETTRS